MNHEQFEIVEMIRQELCWLAITGFSQGSKLDCAQRIMRRLDQEGKLKYDNSQNKTKVL